MPKASKNKWNKLVPSYAFYWWSLAPHGLLTRLVMTGLGKLFTKYAAAEREGENGDDPDLGQLGFHVPLLSLLRKLCRFVRKGDLFVGTAGVTPALPGFAFRFLFPNGPPMAAAERLAIIPTRARH